MPDIRLVHDELKRLTIQWALGDPIDPSTAREVRRRAALANHAHYRAQIPYYQRICDVAGLNGAEPDFDRIVTDLMVPDQIFKSYPARLLDNGDFSGMNAWVTKISDRALPETSGAGNIDEWVAELADTGMHLVFSSGTSGHLSFVPRHTETWHAFLHLAYLYLPALLGRRGVLAPWKNVALRMLSRWMEPAALLKTIQKVGLREFDGYFLNFAGGNQGIQLVGQETARLTARSTFLYEKKMSAAAVRAIVRGPRDETEMALVEDFLDTTVRRKEENYERVLAKLEDSVRAGRKCIMFGTPYLLKELCERMIATGRSLRLPHGSHVTFGGGWKSFDGSAIPEEQLLALISNTFGLPVHSIIEGYSMTEIHGLMLRCSNNRYHVPPFLETVIFDEALRPLSGDDVTGTLGILDPFARSYPGFLITGDNVRVLNETCPCGFSGPAILRVDRSPGKEVKGCGGIMATVNA